LLLLVLFFGSGACALAYEIVWIRVLSLTFPITVYSLTTVLCAFMAGLALGAAISSRLSDRLARPLVAFGILEFGIAACGLAVPALLFNLGPIYVAVHEWLGGSSALFASARFLLAFAVLLVPTTLMGVTLPLLSRAVVDEKNAHSRSSVRSSAVRTAKHPPTLVP
jgi:spermidine synthase